MAHAREACSLGCDSLASIRQNCDTQRSVNITPELSEHINLSNTRRDGGGGGGGVSRIPPT